MGRYQSRVQHVCRSAYKPRLTVEAIVYDRHLDALAGDALRPDVGDIDAIVLHEIVCKMPLFREEGIYD